MNEKGEVASVASEDIKLGSVFPKCNLSWRNDFKWKNLNFGFMLSARFGGIVYSATQSYLDYYGAVSYTHLVLAVLGSPIVA